MESDADRRGKGGWISPDRTPQEDHARIAARCSCQCNFARINDTIRMPPAIACGLEQRLWAIGDIVKLIEASEKGA
jgi:hypothetical protein